MWKELNTVGTSGECCSFLDAIEVWIKKPHVVNRCLCGAKILWQFCSKDVTSTCLEQLITGTGVSKEEQIKILNLVLQLQQNNNTQELKICMRELLPKSLDKNSVLKELVVVDITNFDAFFIVFATVDPNDEVTEVKTFRGYRIHLGEEKTRIMLYVQGIQDDDVQGRAGYTLPWLQDVLLPKIASWSVASKLNTAVTSLRLVPIERYNQLYQNLKKKYGIPLVKIWPEKTDPQKFVYEDIAIATYLLLLWEEDRERKGLTRKQSFVDLGCGNGLLVYILTSEGHKGLGLDLRRRKIWDLFGSEFNLQEQEILPSAENLFPDYDWLIGNHSDELTPWIPVIAARSSFQCCYFVLPCCPHDFSAKFNQKISGTSQYRAYLDFIYEVGTVCGFHVEEDTLRIPSTKRVCFIGRTRTYQLEDEINMDMQRTEYIDYRCSLAVGQSRNALDPNTLQSEVEIDLVTDGEHSSKLGDDDSSGDVQKKPSKRKWAADFQPRGSIEKPRNCVSVSSDIKNHITEAVFAKLLSMEDHQTVKLVDGREWNAGGSLPLCDVADMFDKKMLQELKNECGGLQTLLRNSHHIFRVQGGHVQLRNWITEDYDEYQKKKQRKKGRPSPDVAKRQIKTKLCYFHDHHPQGCPLDELQCRFAHGQKELTGFYKSENM